jgi:hypothetical protein
MQKPALIDLNPEEEIGIPALMYPVAETVAGMQYNSIHVHSHTNRNNQTVPDTVHQERCEQLPHSTIGCYDQQAVEILKYQLIGALHSWLV